MNRNSKKLFITIVAMLLVFSFLWIDTTSAVLGPVTVELNSHRNFSSRANSLNDFTIRFRFNEDIKKGDWLKVWFPVSEAGSSADSICDDIGKEFEYGNTSRLVTDNTFYKITNKETAEIEYLTSSGCEESESRLKNILEVDKKKYLLGTVLPDMPIDEKDRQFILSATHQFFIGYSGCWCGYDVYPIVTQTCDERSIKHFSPYHLESWRQGYNPMDFSISKFFGVIFPATPGRYRVKFATEAEPTPVESDSFVLPCSEISKPNFFYYLNDEGEITKYNVEFNVGEGGALDKDSSKIIIDFPNCFEVAKKYTLSKYFTVNGVQGIREDSNFELDKKNNIISFVSPVDVNNNGHVEIEIDGKLFENKCEEPFSVFVSTTSEPEFIESEALEVKEREIETTLKIIDEEEKLGCDGWYNEPIEIELACNNPDVKVYYYFEGGENDPHEYLKPIFIDDECSIIDFYYYSETDGTKESPNHKRIMIDTSKPEASITYPTENRVYTNKKVFTFRGEIFAENIEENGEIKNQYFDSVTIAQNGSSRISVISKGEMTSFYEDKMAKEWEYKVELIDGTSVFDLKYTDQACNLSFTPVFKITYDITPPEFVVLEPNENTIIREFEAFRVKIETEPDARVFINGEEADELVDTSTELAWFYRDIEMTGIEMVIDIKVVDRAGNSEIKEYMLQESDTRTRLKLWVNTPRFKKNGEEMPELDPKPVNTSPPLPHDLHNNTYMPVRAVYEALGATIGWDGDERRVDATLGDIKVQLWIDNPVAKINGVEKKIIGADGTTVLYPTIVKGRTMLPLRFACESVGADVNWIADEGAIEIVYPTER